MSYFTIANNAVRLGLGALATVALIGSLPAKAEQPMRVVVGFTDLDLTSDAGQSTLDKRIRSAVKRVCSPNIDPLDNHRCRRDSFADAHRQMGVAIAKAEGRKTGIAANLAVAGRTAG